MTVRMILRAKAIVVMLALVIFGGVAVAPLASADVSYPIAWTGIGIYPRTGPSMDAPRAGAALPDGTMVSIQCETTGQVVSNGSVPSAVWERLSDGTYLPNAFISTGVDGWTPGIPSCESLGAPVDAVSETAKYYAGVWVPDDRVSTQLINHYFYATGEPVVVDWEFFLHSPRLVTALRELSQPDGYDVYTANPWDDGDVYYAVGAFTIARTSEHCYAIKDSYDFAPDKLENIPYLLNWVDAQQGRAAEFEVQSSGCIY